MAETSLCHANACAQSQSKPAPITSIGFNADFTNIIYCQDGHLLSIAAQDGWAFLTKHFPKCQLMTAAFRMGMAYQQATGGVDHE